MRIPSTPVKYWFACAPGDLARVGGIAVISGRSVHQSTLFDFEGNTFAERLSGDLHWDRIDKLAKEYDDEEDAHREHLPSNPFPIIKRSREGLESTHPAFIALKKAVTPILAQQVRRLEAQLKAAPAQESDETRRRLQDLGNVLGDYWKKKNEELIDPDDGGSGSGENTAPLRIVPPRKRIDPGETASFSVEALHETIAPPEPVTLTVVANEPAECVAKLSTQALELAADPDDSRRYHGTFRVGAGDCFGEVLIEAVCGDDRAELDVNIAHPSPIDVPSALQFSQDQYTVRPKKQKSVIVQAPTYLVEQHGKGVSLRVSSADFTLKKRQLQLKLRPDKLFYEAATAVGATRLGAKAKLTAEQDKLVAVTRLHVADEEKRPKISIELTSIDSPQRAQVETQDGGLLIKINATHSSIKRYLGPHPQYADQNTPLARVMMGEVAGKELVAYFLKRFYLGTEIQIDQLEWKRVREEATLMRQVHEVMLSNSEVRASQHLARTEKGATPEVA